MVRNISRGRPRRSSWKGASRTTRRTFRESQRPSLPRWYKCEGADENRLSVEREKSRDGAAIRYVANLPTKITCTRVTSTRRNPQRGDSYDKYFRSETTRRHRRENPRSKIFCWTLRRSESSVTIFELPTFYFFFPSSLPLTLWVVWLAIVVGLFLQISISFASSLIYDLYITYKRSRFSRTSKSRRTDLLGWLEEKIETERFCLSLMPIWKQNGARIVQDFREEYPCHWSREWRESSWYNCKVLIISWFIFWWINCFSSN